MRVLVPRKAVAERRCRRRGVSEGDGNARGNAKNAKSERSGDVSRREDAVLLRAS